MMQLLKIIQRENEITVNYDQTNSDEKNLLEFFSFIKDLDDPIITPGLVDELLPLLSSYNEKISFENDKMKSIINYLARKTNETKVRIIEFIRLNSNLSKSKMKPIEEFINNINEWNKVFEYKDGDGLLHVDIDNESDYRAIGYLKNSIINLISVFPNIIINGVDYKIQSILKHWKLSDRHNNDVQKIIENFYKPLVKFYDNEHFIEILNRFIKLTKNLKTFLNLLPSFDLLDDTRANPFNHKIILRLLQFLFLSCFEKYITSIDTKLVTPSDERSSGMIVTRVVEDSEIGNIEELDIVSGETLEINNTISLYLIETIKIFAQIKKTVNYSLQDIMNKVNVSKEKEKDQVTQRLKDLSDEEREVENLFKNHKLGQWSKGLQKGTTQYVRETYDEEREIMERQMELERKLGKEDNVTAMNRDIYMLDMEAQEASDTMIEREEMGLQHLGEDDDYGDMDGDEYY